MVTDYGPGHDSEQAFQTRLQGRGRQRSSARCAFRSRTPTSPPSCSAPRTLTPESNLHLHPGRGAARGARARRSPSAASTRRRPRCSARASHRRGGAQGHGRRRARHRHRLALRLQARQHAEPGVREGVQRRCTAATRTSSRSAATTACTYLRDAEEDQGQHRRRGDDRGGQGHGVGEPARPDVDRPGDARRGADGVHPPRREGRRRAGERASSTTIEKVKDPAGERRKQK